MAPTLPGMIAFEAAEVRRLTRALARPLEATVACVLPTYRRHDQLLKAVASILAQNYQDWVLIVVDDGGGLPELPSDPRIHAVSLSRNTRVAGLVRNVGLRLTRSTYVAFLDDDNTWTPEHLTVTVAVLEEGHDLVYTAIRRMSVDGVERDVLSRDYDRRTHADESSYVDTNAIVARRTQRSQFSRLPRTRTTQPREDWEFVFRNSRDARVRHIPIPTVEYLINSDSYYTEWN
jgi:glycosyltransferase involved in cell wall biosynthesis